MATAKTMTKQIVKRRAFVPRLFPIRIFVTSIGKVGNSLALLEEIGFPPELILNGEYNRFLQVVREKTGRFQ